MADIKTREVIKGSIKTIETVAAAGGHMKGAYVRTREMTETSDRAEKISDQCAVDGITEMAESAASKTVGLLKKQGRKGLESAKEQLSKEQTFREKYGKEYFVRQMKEEIHKKQTKDRRRIRTKNTIDTGQRITQSAGKSIKTAEQGTQTMKQSANIAFQKSQAAKKAKEGAQVATKRIAKAAVTAVKVIIHSTKDLIAVLAAGGWMAVVIIIVLTLVALVAGSCFGIFFSGEDTGTGMTMQSVVQEINEEYQDKINSIMENNLYDVLEIEVAPAVWQEVLAVYAIKTTTDQDNARDVAVMDETRKAILRDIFWHMNIISYQTECVTETVMIETEDEDGKRVEAEESVSRIYLRITVEHKTAVEMAEELGFDAEQRELLAELLSHEKDTLWDAVLI